MSRKPTHQNQTLLEKDKQRHLQPVETNQLTPEQLQTATQAQHLVHGPDGVIGRGSANYQISRLADPALATGERHFMTEQVGQIQGNNHLQRVVDTIHTHKDNKTPITNKQSNHIQRQATPSSTEMPSAAETIDVFLGDGGFFNLATAGTPPNNNQNSSPLIQAKFSVNAPDDQYEQEADQVADVVMSLPQSVQPTQLHDESPSSTQGLTIPSSPNISRISRSSASAVPEVTSEIESNINAMQGSGQSLPKAEQNFFESRMGHDFSQVRIHTNARSVDTSQVLQAKAFTVGPDIAFNNGEYQPGTDSGRTLLAHELTHVVQQGGSNALGGNIQAKLVDLPEDASALTSPPVELDEADSAPAETPTASAPEGVPDRETAGTEENTSPPGEAQNETPETGETPSPAGENVEAQPNSDTLASSEGGATSTEQPSIAQNGSQPNGTGENGEVDATLKQDTLDLPLLLEVEAVSNKEEERVYLESIEGQILDIDEQIDNGLEED